ncbi:MAG: class I SAM-dependent methyltransferase [Bryobacterales bacterium]|nr:class I SAM-dependent methyltransferase [Bryobacterales bacterium]
MSHPETTNTAPACPACDAREFKERFQLTDRLYHTTREQFSILECKVCGLLRLYPWPDAAVLDRYYPPGYWFSPQPDTAHRLEEAYRRLVLRDHVRFVRTALRHSSAHGLVLDVGCGGGLFLHLLHEEGFPVAGLDFSFEAASVAWKRNGVPAVCANLGHAPVSAETCSGVTMFHVLEHVYDPAAYLECAHRMLKPDGRLIVQVPNAECWQFRVFSSRWNGLDVPRHLINFRRRDILRLIELAGFEIVREKHFSLRDNPAGFATSVSTALDPMARRVRGVKEGGAVRLVKDLVYFCLVVAGLPFAALEALFNAGSSIMIEARKKQ